MKSLKYISLARNWFNDSIPPALGALPSLKNLDLSMNILCGLIPPELGNISSLMILDLSDNRLSGQLPYQLGNLKNLISLLLRNNEFTGELHHNFAKLTNILSFYITGNNFTGRIPEYLANWKNLRRLSLMGNNLEGPLPNAISSLTKLRYLYVADLIEGHGGGRGFLFPDLSAVTSLVKLTLRNCSLTGPIPKYIGQLPAIYYLDLSFNNLAGEIPIFFNPKKPQYIFLKGNKLNGTLPGWLSNLKDSFVDVSENSFTNVSIQSNNMSKNLNLFECCSNEANMNATWQISNYHFGNETPLYDQLYINCGGNSTSINGIQYEADLHPNGGSTFFLSDNKRWAYSSMGKFISEEHDKYIVNRICGITMADAPLYTTARISPISLKYYGFCLKNDNYIVKLHFAEIAAEANKGPSNKEKRVFDVEIQGKKVLRNFNIEEAAGGVNKDITLRFNVSVDKSSLVIHLYWAGKGSINGPMSNYGPAISAISVSPVPKSKSVRKLSATSIAEIVGSSLVLPILILVFLWKLGWFAGKNLHAKGTELLPGGLFNFRQIKAATQNFHSANKIGKGGFGAVYKGVLPDGTAIAVKQLSAKSKQGIREFVNEVGTTSSLQHQNLVRLLGCCSENNQLLLVYEYMEYNSLANVLFGPEELRVKLNWPTRVNICLGIAKGLAFLHEESQLKIVHRDIKPTNILLDRELNPKISDFGYAKLYEGGKTHVITRIAGTTGYMAPEYAMRGLLTSKADVYSFGVVTLEIVSGQNSTTYRPNDESVYLLDLAYVLQEKGNLIELVDPSLGSDYSWREANTILELAMQCTNPSPTLRPNMTEVVKVLEGKSKINAPQFSSSCSMVDISMARAVASLSQSTRSGCTSREGTTNNTTSHAVCKEIEESSVSADCSTEKNV